ncbi:MAG: FtsX-like permease family protein [Actinomycetes bacterium]
MLRTSLRSVFAHKVRLLLSGLAIVLGVAFVVGTLIFTDTLKSTFTDLFSQTTTDVVVSPVTQVDSDVAGSIATLPASVLDTVRGVDGVAKAAGAVFVDGVTIVGSDGKPVGTQGAPQFGSNWDDDQSLTPYRLVEGTGPKAAGQIAVDSVAAEHGGFSIGDTVDLVTPSGPASATLVGIFRFGTSGNLAGATITTFDTATAQKLLLGGHDSYTEVDAVAAEGVSQVQLAADVSSALDSPKTIKVQTGADAADEAAAAINDGLQFVNIFLLVFAGIALFVGTFIILNTFAMLVSQRSRELALLRAVGATRGQVVRLVLAEAAIVGLIGSVVGIALGVGVAVGLQGLFNAVGASIPTGGLAIEPRTLVVGLVVGLVVTVLAAFPPARRASRIPPVAALRDDVTLPSRSLRIRALLGSIALVLGLTLMTLGVREGGSSGSSLVGLGTVVTLVAAIVLSPVVSGPVVRVIGGLLPLMFGTVGRLAVDNAERQPRRTAATASALMIGIALVTALTIFATSTSTSVAKVVDRVIGAEFLISTQTQRPFPDSVATAVSGVDGIAAVASVKQVPAKVDGADTVVVGLDPSSIGQMLDLTFITGSLADLDTTSVVVDDKTATNAGLSVGDSVTVVLPSGSATYTVAGTYSAAAGFSGYAMSNDALAATGLRLGDSFVYAKTAEGANLDAVQASLEEALVPYPTVRVQSQAQFKESIRSNVNQLLAVMVLLLSLAIVIAVLGIVNTLVLSVIERTREIGMLRAVGALRRQVRRMVVLEAIVIAVYGAVLGLVLGLGFAVALQRTLVDQGIEVLDVPWLALAAFFVLAALVGALAALWPAFRAGRLDVLRAVTTE